MNRGKVGSGLDEAQGAAPPAGAARPLAGGAPGDADAPRGDSRRRRGRPRAARAGGAGALDGFSEDGQLLHAVYAVVRDDVDAAGVYGRAARRASRGSWREEPTPASAAAAPVEPARRRSRASVAVTNPRKVLWPGEGITKADLVAYYRAIAPAMLALSARSPVMLVRYPDGIEGKSLLPVERARWGRRRGLKTFRLPGDDGAEEADEVFLVDGERALSHVANLAAIPIHVLACARRRRWTLRLPHHRLRREGRGLARGDAGVALRELLDGIGLAGYPRPRGRPGSTCCARSGRGCRTRRRGRSRISWEAALRAAPGDRHHGADRGEARAARVRRHRQTGPTRTIVAPWRCGRARGHGVGAAPLGGGGARADPDRVHACARRRRASTPAGDPMAGMLAARPDVAAAVGRLEGRVRGAR